MADDRARLEQPGDVPLAAERSSTDLAEAEALLERALSAARTRRPTATYRVQLHAGFGFRDARAIVPYLDALGITDVYVSPFLRAKPGSKHGYDVVDHGVINPEIGTEGELAELVAELRDE